MTISELPVVRIIDDNDVMRESLVFLLEEEDGWIVKAYRDAEEFLGKLCKMLDSSQWPLET
ncbi:hypothetical protein [Parasutterella excrementihominis]|uniref:hypothetical protein n=1 Tax=Parasutterella excrementihominis TaxID=487175 RepID=UPI0024305CF6|nr:hypothetical protein [Parasutterella excrementihominis]